MSPQANHSHHANSYTDIQTIFVGSANPVKINAVVLAASETWPSVQVTGFDVPSGIPEQPIGDEETRQGARNRAKAAFAQGLQSLQSDQLNQSPNFEQSVQSAQITQIDQKRPIAENRCLGVGLEGGVVELKDGMYSTVWICVTDHTGRFYESNGARFLIPDMVAEAIRGGAELGPVVAQMTGVTDVRKKQGMIGIITNGFVDRTEEYTGITKMALGLWYGAQGDSALQ